ncbi:MAG TPA: non-heme iron oxygenase ferredoxin subunit [Methylomirabilota bacterium]|nr:non-heme iron oxygenase ferredoxin subunit [Methylomirabilota bacterium]
MTEFVRACALSDLPDEGALGVDIGDVPVAVVRAEGEVFALHDVCSHEEVPLSEGDIYDCTVECYLHGSCFDLRTGKPTSPPATKPVPTYLVKIENGDVYVALDAGNQAGPADSGEM